MVDQPFFLPAAIIGVLEIPLILGLVPRNRLYGVRTSKTLADDRAWYPANRVGGLALLSSSLCYLLVAAVAPYDASTGWPLGWLLHLVAFAGPLVLSLLIIRNDLRQR